MKNNHLEDEFPELRKLPREAEVPAALEGRVAEALRREGLLRGTPPALRKRLAWLPAAAALLFAAGWFAHSLYLQASRVPLTAGKQYLLLLRQGAMVETSPSEEDALVKEYAAWGRALHEKGELVLAEKLADDLRLLPAAAQDPAHIPQVESVSRVQGFFLIRATSLEDALRIARECPHLRHGGSIEVRPIAAM